MNNPIGFTDPTGHCTVGGHWLPDDSSACQWAAANQDSLSGPGNGGFVDEDDGLPDTDEVEPVTPGTTWPCGMGNVFAGCYGDNAYLRNFNLFACNVNDNAMCILNWLFPSHWGMRTQLEFSLIPAVFGPFGIGPNASIGVQWFYDRYSDQIGADIDWAVIPVFGTSGPSAIGTVGPAFGFGAGDLRPLIETSPEGIIAVSAADLVAGSASATVSGVDPVSGINPTTFYLGGGFGGPYKAVAGGAGFNRIDLLSGIIKGVVLTP